MPEERNYHIFYRLLAGLTEEEKASLHLMVPKDYHYLSQGNCFTCEGMDDGKEFTNIRRAMKVDISITGCKKIYTQCILRCGLSGVIHIFLS